MDKILIAPFKHGMQDNLVEFMLPDDAFQSLENMIIYQGKIKRRPGSQHLDTTDARGLTSRLRINVAITDPAGNAGPFIVPGTASIGQQFSVADTIFTVYQANGAMSVSPAGATGTFNVGTSTATIVGAAPGTTIYWYPSQPVIGFATYFQTDGTNLEFAFDLQFAYKYDTTTGGWERVTLGAGLFASTVNQRISWVNFQGSLSGEPALIVTTKNDNGLRYYTATTPTFTNLLPATSAVANYNVRRCKYVINFQGRLLLLNTTEREGNLADTIKHVNRIRYSAFGDAFSPDSWYSPPDISNKGGFVDLPSGVEINNAEILDGRLIVFSDDSIYELVPTGNYREPFQVALVDNTHGNKSTGVVEVNNMLMFANNFGFYFYDGRNVNKASVQLGDETDTFEYLYGTIHKDSSDEFIYILTSTTFNNVYGNRLQIYNFRNNTFSEMHDLCTTIGTMYHLPNGNLRFQQRTMIGNHRGYTFVLISTQYRNDASQSVISMTRFDAQNIDLKIYNHQLEVDSFIRIENSLLPGFNGSYQIESVLDVDTIRVLNDTSVVGNYLGDGTIALIDQIQIFTKQFNPYMNRGLGTSINKVTFNVNRTTTNGRISVVGGPNNAAYEVEDFNFYLGDRKLDTAAYALISEEANQSKLWHDVYTQTTGQSVSLVLSFDQNELLDPDLPYQQLTINAIMLHVTPAVSL